MRIVVRYSEHHLLSEGHHDIARIERIALRDDRLHVSAVGHICRIGTADETALAAREGPGDVPGACASRSARLPYAELVAAHRRISLICSVRRSIAYPI